MTEKRLYREQSLNLHIGRCIASRRTELGMALDDVARGLALPGEQIAEFERGAARPTPPEILKLCTLLRVQPSWFFEGL